MAVRTSDYKDLVPPLSDVHIVFMDRDRMILRGIEILNTSRGAVEVLQEWVISSRWDY